MLCLSRGVSDEPSVHAHSVRGYELIHESRVELELVAD